MHNNVSCATSLKLDLKAFMDPNTLMHVRPDRLFIALKKNKAKIKISYDSRLNVKEHLQYKQLSLSVSVRAIEYQKDSKIENQQLGEQKLQSKHSYVIKKNKTAELTQQRFKQLRAATTAARCAETFEQMHRQLGDRLTDECRSHKYVYLQPTKKPVLNMEDLLRKYVGDALHVRDELDDRDNTLFGKMWKYTRYTEIDFRSLRKAVWGIEPARLLRLLLTIKYDSNTAVMIAVNKGQTKICCMFLSPLRGIADQLLCIKEKESEKTVLHLAAQKGDNTSVELLLDTVSDERKYEFIAEKDKHGATAIELAALQGSSECISILLKNFSTPHRNSLLKIQNNDLQTALHIAAANGNTYALKVMLESASLETVSSLLVIKSKYNRTPLDEAVDKKTTRSSELLMSWQLKLAVEATAEAKRKISNLRREGQLKVLALQEETEQQARALAAANKTISELQEAEKRTTRASAASQRIFNDQNEKSQQKLEVLQEKTDQQAKALAAANKTISDLQDAEKGTTRFLAVADLTISDLKMADKQKSQVLEETKQDISNIQHESQQKISVLKEKSDQQTKALAAANEKISDLQDANKETTRVLAVADQTISDLKMADKRKSKALDETRQQIRRLQNESERRLSLVQDEARQQKADMAAMQRRLEQFTMYLQAPGDTNSMGNQYHAPDS
ncbi:myosin-13-like [Watersipora subatra]|uniref:myosin-13-like n=1 Tax=Watersipora subatra TaxID=2589382 RepID=UPI00355AE629